MSTLLGLAHSVLFLIDSITILITSYNSQQMMRKESLRNNKLDKIVELNQSEVPHEAVVATALNKNRVSLGSVLARQPSKKNNLAHINEEESIKQKEILIKQLQQQITFKKEQNDAVQQAFRARQQDTSFFDKTQKPITRLKSIVVGCSYAASHSKTFKSALLKQLRLISREWKVNRVRAVRLLLLWIMQWINNMFNMLGKSLSRQSK